MTPDRAALNLLRAAVIDVIRGGGAVVGGRTWREQLDDAVTESDRVRARESGPSGQ